MAIPAKVGDRVTRRDGVQGTITRIVDQWHVEVDIDAGGHPYVERISEFAYIGPDLTQSSQPDEGNH